jgi:hypothetical protein
VFGIELVDLACVGLFECRPSKLIDEDAVPQAKVLLHLLRIQVSILAEDDMNRKHDGIPLLASLPKGELHNGCPHIPGCRD